MKKEFYLTPVSADYRGIKMEIIGTAKNDNPYLAVGYSQQGLGTLEGKDLERFAVNILKALGSKKLERVIRTKSKKLKR